MPWFLARCAQANPNKLKTGNVHYRRGSWTMMNGASRRFPGRLRGTGRRLRSSGSPKERVGNSLAPDHPHHILHHHFATTFACATFESQGSCNPPRGPDITSDELDFALQRGRLGRSVGIDGVSLEVIKSIVEHDESKRARLRWYNSILHSGSLPQQWQGVLLILLPKVESPQLPKQVREIAVGCATEKLLTRVILERSKASLLFSTLKEFCAPKRQSADLIFSLHRLAEVERE